MTAVFQGSSLRDRRRLSKRKPNHEADFLTPFESVSLGLSGFFFRDGFLGPQLAKELRAETLRIVKSGVLRPAGIGRSGTLDPITRGDHLCWMEPRQAGRAVKMLMARFELLRKSLNRQFFLGLDRYEMQLALYHPGSQGYQRHLDAFRGSNQRNRRLTAIVYLNPSWKADDGGELALYLPQSEIRLEPVADRLVVFFAEEVEHAVLPVQNQRLALTAWFHSP